MKKEPANNQLQSQVYEMNLAILDSLEDMEMQDCRLKRRERFWRRSGPFMAVAPLVTAGVLMATHTGRNMELDEKLATDVYSVIGSAVVGLTALHGYDKNRRLGQKLAEDALPVSYIVSRSTQPWIQKRLAERDEDVQKQAQQMGNT
jgi:hypothetical protein